MASVQMSCYRSVGRHRSSNVTGGAYPWLAPPFLAVHHVVSMRSPESATRLSRTGLILMVAGFDSAAGPIPGNRKHCRGVRALHLRLSTVRDTVPPCTTPHLGSPQYHLSSLSLTSVTHLNPICAQSMADARRPPPTSARGLQSVKPGGSIAVQHPHGQAGEPRAGAGASAAAAWAGTGGWLVVRYRWWSNCTFCT